MNVRNKKRIKINGGEIAKNTEGLILAVSKKDEDFFYLVKFPDSDECLLEEKDLIFYNKS